MNKLENAIETWAFEYAAVYERFGRKRGDSPTSWCTESEIKNMLQDSRSTVPVLKELVLALRAAFLRAAVKS